MSTVIYPSPIFGPVHSRRLGVSLGINLLPGDGKVCSFDCIYCECGFNADRRPHAKLPTREQVSAALEAKLRQMADEGTAPDVLTFAGNGEPTMHPQFADIIADTLLLRDRYFPRARISVLSNATRLGDSRVHAALMQVDNNIVKLDTVDNAYVRRLDRPVSADYDVRQVVAQMKAFGGHCIVQTMFLRGTFEGHDVTNVGDEYVSPWLDALQEIRPQAVMVYTIDRETPAHQLLKATREELDDICSRVQALGIACSASY